MCRLGWAFFVGVSWTWCIGMFLPVLIVREFGIAGWIAFAVPNVIGATGLGWFIREKFVSRQIVHRHRPACLIFSMVTIAFQFYFSIWMLELLAGFNGRVLVACSILLFYLLGRSRRSNDLRSAALAWAISIVGIMIFVLASPDPADIPIMARSTSLLDLAALSLVCVFGFMLCPYLDLTFHRARRSLDTPDARFAFGFGFAFIFLAMIIGTLLYARALNAAAFESLKLDRVAAGALAGHFIVQLGFTIAIHHREVKARAGRKMLLVESLLFAAGVILLLYDGLNLPFSIGHITGPEVIYRLFMSFYGVIFPAYVWLCMIPAAKNQHANRSQLLVIFWLAVALAAPMFWIGFIQQRFIWLIPGLAVLIAAKFVPIGRRAQVQA